MMVILASETSLTNSVCRMRAAFNTGLVGRLYLEDRMGAAERKCEGTVVPRPSEQYAYAYKIAHRLCAAAPGKLKVMGSCES